VTRATPRNSALHPTLPFVAVSPREILAQVYGQSTQWFETTDLIAAKRLLSEP
jgi:hypothetical protein